MAVPVHGFVDEGGKRARLLVVAVAQPSQLTQARTALLHLCRPGQRRLHFSTESDRRRRLILSRVVEIGVPVRLYDTHGRDANVARSTALAQMVTDLAPGDPHRLVLESRQGRDKIDSRALYESVRKTGLSQSLVYEHLLPHMEPMLWIPDAVAWAYAKGGDWRRRIAPLVEHVAKVVT